MIKNLYNYAGIYLNVLLLFPWEVPWGFSTMCGGAMGLVTDKMCALYILILLQIYVCFFF